jgi:phosphoglucomutase
MILSASGWRTVFDPEGDEEGRGSAISPAHRLAAAGAAKVFADYLQGDGKPGIILGMDTRPTGSAIADAVMRTFLALGRDLRFPGIAAAPEIMAYARSFPLAGRGAPGFVYISASHNPAGHNGFKFGLAGGGVLPGEENSLLAERFRALMASGDWVREGTALLEKAPPDRLAEVLAAGPEEKRASLGAYGAFLKELITGSSGGGRTEELFAELRRGTEKRKLGVGADFNGSARTLSVDGDFFRSLGIAFYAINDRPGEFRHAIIPEGDALEPCRLLIGELRLEDPSVEFGYVPDCDGDRGNLVIYDENSRGGRILDAQEVFALSCIGELSYMVRTGELSYDNKGNALSRAALAVNDPTSLRIDRIARAFDVPVFRAEVGEANVTGLAARLRERGYAVRILGEGSNGGVIIHPSEVRDPLAAAGAVIKLLTLRRTEEKEGLFKLWCDLSDQAENYREDFTLSDIIATLPAFVTTAASSPEAKLRVKTGDQGLLKSRYQKVFLREWEQRKEELLARYGILSWDVRVYNGMEERRGVSDFGEARQGGLKICFANGEGRTIAFLWMRGSATEKIFRIMADAEGPDRRMERDLIGWQRRMVEEADAEA